jgi:hypothetical protein
MCYMTILIIYQYISVELDYSAVLHVVWMIYVLWMVFSFLKFKWSIDAPNDFHMKI